MALDINALRAAFSKKSEGGENTGFWDKFYPFYKMELDQTAIFRFLPDLDDNNPLGFIVENKYHQLTVNGQKKKIACLKMYGEACPCCEMSSKYYGEGNKNMGLAFWRKIDYIAQGLVIQSPFEYPVKADENPVRLVSLGPKLYKVIESQIVKNIDMEAMPYDLAAGYNFHINKTKQGEYSDYTTSSFRAKSTPIPEDLLSRIELHQLANFRFAKIEREQMDTMIEAFLTGKSYEAEKTAEGSTTSTVETPKATQPAAEVVAAAAAAQPSATPAAPAATGQKLSATDILAKLRARSQNPAQ